MLEKPWNLWVSQNEPYNLFHDLSFYYILSVCAILEITAVEEIM